MGFENPFSFPILHEIIDDGEKLADDLCEYAYDLRDQDPNGKLISHAWHQYERAKSPEDYKKHGYTSHGNFELRDDERFDPIHRAIVKQCQKYTNSLN